MYYIGLWHVLAGVQWSTIDLVCVHIGGINYFMDAQLSSYYSRLIDRGV